MTEIHINYFQRWSDGLDFQKLCLTFGSHTVVVMTFANSSALITEASWISDDHHTENDWNTEIPQQWTMTLLTSNIEEHVSWRLRYRTFPVTLLPTFTITNNDVISVYEWLSLRPHKSLHGWWPCIRCWHGGGCWPGPPYMLWSTTRWGLLVGCPLEGAAPNDAGGPMGGGANGGGAELPVVEGGAMNIGGGPDDTGGRFEDIGGGA